MATKEAERLEKELSSVREAQQEKERGLVDLVPHLDTLCYLYYINYNIIYSYIYICYIILLIGWLFTLERLLVRRAGWA